MFIDLVAPKLTVNTFFFKQTNSIGFSLFPLALMMLIAIEVRWRERQRAMLAEHEQERQAYMLQVLKAQEDERRRTSRELHDGTIQELLLIANRVQSLIDDRGSVDQEQMKERLEQIMNEAFNVSEGVRRLSLDLRPSVLDNTGLVPALRSLADRLFQESGIEAKVAVEGRARRFHADTEIQIFRIVQEALSNVRRHSRATAVTITLSFTRHRLGITIRDNGIGFHVEDILKNLANHRKLGIASMQQRAILIGGTLDIHSQPGEGTVISIEIVEQPVKSMPAQGLALTDS